jgi:hypothetical protein
MLFEKESLNRPDSNGIRDCNLVIHCKLACLPSNYVNVVSSSRPLERADKSIPALEGRFETGKPNKPYR